MGTFDLLGFLGAIDEELARHAGPGEGARIEIAGDRPAAVRAGYGRREKENPGRIAAYGNLDVVIDYLEGRRRVL